MRKRGLTTLAVVPAMAAYAHTAPAGAVEFLSLGGLPGGDHLHSTGYNPDGKVEAWIAHIPEPATLALLLCGVAIAPRPRR